MRDPDGWTYFKEEVGGLVVGGFEPDAKPWRAPSDLPHPFEFQLLDEDWEHFSILMEQAIVRIPALAETGIRKFYNGPESFTPDNQFLLGQAPGLHGYFVGAGFNSVGIASAGGAGRALAEWIVEGEPTSDLVAVDVRRFAPFHGDEAWLRSRVAEILGLHYEVPWPLREPETGRPQRVSPLHDRLADRGAVFGSRMGWERPVVFRPTGATGRHRHGHGVHLGTAGLAALVRRRAARDAGAGRGLRPDVVLAVRRRRPRRARLPAVDLRRRRRRPGRRLCLHAVPQRPRHLRGRPHRHPHRTATPSCWSRARPRRSATWTGSTGTLRAGADVTVRDCTDDLSVIGVMGPRSRDLLGRVSTGTTDAEPATGRTSRSPSPPVGQVTIGDVGLRATRMTYVGEVGWELVVPVSDALAVYDALRAAGDELGLADAGYHAIESLRLEKGYRAFGRDLTPDLTPVEAGLVFATALSARSGVGKDFLGREALTAHRDRLAVGGERRRLVSFVLDDPEPMVWGGELVLRDGEPTGQVTSAAYGATVGASVGLALLRTDRPVRQATWTRRRSRSISPVTRHPARVTLAAPLP